MATYHEITIKGDGVALSSFLRGFLAGKGVTSGFYFSTGMPLNLPHLREMIKYHGQVVHLLCRSSLRATILSAVKKAGDEFEVKDVRKASSFSFGFDFETANREVGAAIKRALKRLPAGVTLVDYEPLEVIDPEAKGVEVYTPTHDYEFRGKGRVRGDLEGVLKMHARLSDDSHFRVDKIDIRH